jgi:hypothetical protein
MAHSAMAYLAMAYLAMAYLAMAYLATAYLATAYLATACHPVIERFDATACLRARLGFFGASELLNIRHRGP